MDAQQPVLQRVLPLLATAALFQAALVRAEFEVGKAIPEFALLGVGLTACAANIFAQPGTARPVRSEK